MDLNLDSLQGFLWDKGNEQKSFIKHGITALEAEETFFNPNFLSPDTVHSQKEQRYRLLGKTNTDKILLIVFTIRNNKARIISSRFANKKERIMYAQAIKNNS